MKDFNTSHVTVYRRVCTLYSQRIYNFNTSHVTVYLSKCHIYLAWIEYFNTSHVTVYLLTFCQITVLFQFQYISCYCLSLRKGHITGGRKNFNTSHVTVYLDLIIYSSTQSLFQYISCYCLSELRLAAMQILRDFNTSHVTVYRLWVVFVGFSFTNFNTSHVTVYLFHRTQVRQILLFQYISCYCLSFYIHSESDPFLISIHLMLLFIFFCSSVISRPASYFNTSHVTVYRRKGLNSFIVFAFQYISCYCLSFPAWTLSRNAIISIHLMLLFIWLQYPVWSA